MPNRNSNADKPIVDEKSIEGEKKKMKYYDARSEVVPNGGGGSGTGPGDLSDRPRSPFRLCGAR